MGGQSKRGEKTVYKIGEVAAMTKLPAYVLRFWESEFAFLRPKKSPGRHRVYTQVDIETVLEIKRMLYEEGYTIAGLKRYWNRRKRNSTQAESNIPRHRVERVKAELQAILTKLTSS